MPGSQGEPSADPMIELRDVSKTYAGGSIAVQDLSLSVRRGELACLVGPSGCGKSTTLKMINRLVEPTTGQIFLGGREVTHADPVVLRRGIGYVIQNVGLFPHQRVLSNVMTVPLLLGTAKSEARTQALDLLDQVGLDPSVFADRYPHQLSGGQQQRVGVARALAADPPVLLMDEPFGAVDPMIRAHLQDTFLELQQRLHKTVVMVTHDIDEAIRMGDRIAVFTGAGRLAQYDSPARILAAPAEPFVADFIGNSRQLRRLAVTPIDLNLIDPVDSVLAADLGATVDSAASLEEVLALMLGSDKRSVGVVEGTRFLGVLTPDTVHATLRATERDPLSP